MHVPFFFNCSCVLRRCFSETRVSLESGTNNTSKTQKKKTQPDITPKTNPGRPRDLKKNIFVKSALFLVFWSVPGVKKDTTNHTKIKKTWFRSVPFNMKQKQQNPDRVFLVFEALRGGPGTRKYSKNVVLSFKIAGLKF